MPCCWDALHARAAHVPHLDSNALEVIPRSRAHWFTGTNAEDVTTLRRDWPVPARSELPVVGNRALRFRSNPGRADPCERTPRVGPQPHLGLDREVRLA